MEIPRFADEKKLKDHGKFLEHHLENLEQSAEKSEGFMFIDPEHITIKPTKGGGGVLEIREPQDKRGIEHFNLRDKFEKAWPVGDIEPSAEWENQVFKGEIYPPEFNPEFGGRVCLTAVNIYETKDDTLISMPILPLVEHKYRETKQRFGGKGKLGGANMLKGDDFQVVHYLLDKALEKEQNTLDPIQVQNPHERIIGQPTLIETGGWKVKFVDRYGKEAEVPGCFIHRDPKTGTFEIFKIQRRFVIGEEEKFHTMEKLPPGLKRLNTVVSLRELRKKKKGDPVEIKKMFFGDSEVTSLEELSDDYRDLFEMSDGKPYLSELAMTPPLEAFLLNEEKVISKAEQAPESRSGVGNIIGGLMEKIVEKAMQAKDRLIKHNNQYLQTALPADLMKKIGDLPEDFQKWALEFSQKNEEVRIRPDFIMADKSVIELKAGKDIKIGPNGKIDMSKKAREQLYRNILYMTLNNIRPKIRFLILDFKQPGMQDLMYPFVSYEDILQTKDLDLTEWHLGPIRHWQERLKNKKGAEASFDPPRG